MVDYIYTAKDKSTDKVMRGKIQADNELAAADILGKKGLYPIKIEPAAEGGFSKEIKIGSGVSGKDRVIFTRQLATLVKAGLPITQALNTAIEQITNKTFHAMLEKIAASVEGGTSLANSFAQHPETFNHVYVSLVHAGEESGTLDDALERLADQQEKEQQIISKVRGALIYPALVLAVIVVVLVFMLVSVLPQIASLYKDLGKDLPILTKITFATSEFLVRYWWLTLIVLIAIVFGLRAYFRTPQGRRNWDRFKLNAPVFGGLFKKVYMARFARTMASLVNSGVPILEALNISSEAVNNVILKAEIDEATLKVRSGKALSSALMDKEHFLKLVPQMIKVGEQSGTLGAMLDKVASFYEDEVDQTVKNLSTTIEPVMMIILGLLVGVIIVAILYPVYSLVGGGINLNPSAGAPTVQQ
ncbi:type II secretion system F family protein [Candidatus Saccharibacteria bacterium]|nr:type II secretion system F family protein [Candidatus Saccharibacteria bacterium]